MCPACFETTALVVSVVTSAGGVVALVMKTLDAKREAQQSAAQPKPKESLQ